MISAPTEGAVDATIVMGVNQDTYDPACHDVISNASCTTNCAPPMVGVLDRHFGVVRGFLTTIHGYTNDQQLDLAVQLARPASVEDVNAAYESDAAGRLRGILRVTSEPLVSCDITGERASCVLDSALTQAGGELVKVFGWYDNEWSYTERLADLADYVGAAL